MRNTALSISEENYLKAIYKLSSQHGTPVPTNALAKELSTSAASVTDMIKRLHEKKMIDYTRYQGVALSEEGARIATNMIRRHRLWECFLVQKLNYDWVQVHDLAEQLEHIHSEDLIDRLEEFLEFPRFDPHGDPIPDKSGKFTIRAQYPINTLDVGDRAEVIGVGLHDAAFLKFLAELNIEIGSKIDLMEKFDYDDSHKVKINDSEPTILSPVISANIYVKKI